MILLVFFIVKIVIMLFLFENKEDRSQIYRFATYFIGTRGKFLTHWSLVFNSM